MHSEPLVALESQRALTKPGADVLAEIVGQRPRFSAELLTRDEKNRCVERGLLGLYRWYVTRSQASRNWNPDGSFAWKSLRKDHCDAVHTIIEGFYAVEQYVPDYVHTLLRVIRTSYGRSHFHIRWGAEEEKHADVWRNTVLPLGRRNGAWMENYTDTLRKREMQLPWDDPLRMLFYTLFQERATQVNYLNLALVATGDMRSAVFSDAADPVLAQVCRTIAVDEAAHYHFFLEAARLFLYYFPADAVDAMADVIRNFAMPAGDIIPDYDRFGAALHETHIFSWRIHHRDVVTVALRQLGASSLRATEAGIMRSREAPRPDGALQTTTIFDAIDHDHVERSVSRLFGRIGQYAAESGVEHTIDATFQRARIELAEVGQNMNVTTADALGEEQLADE